MGDYRIAEARAAKGWTQTDLAKAIGTTQQQIARYERQENDVKSSVLMKMSDALGVTVSYLLGITDSPKVVSTLPSKSRNVPIVGRMAAGEAREAIEQRDRTHPTCDGLLEGNEDSAWVEVSGNSMNRLFPDGCLVLINRRDEVKNGDVAAVFVNGDDVTIKRVYFEHGTVRLHPESYDPEYRDRVIDESDPDAPSVHFLGRAVTYQAPLGWRP